MDNNNATFQIALSKAQQYAIIGYCLTTEDFFYKCKQYINPSWFEDVFLANIFEQLVIFFDKYKILPKSEHELFSEPFFRGQSLADGKKYYEAVELAKAYSKNFTLEVLRNHLTNFVRVVSARSLAKNLVHQINKHNYDIAVQSAEKISLQWREINFNPPSAIDFTDTVSMWFYDNNKNNKSFSTGSKQLDEMLAGALEPGGNLAVLAPTFVGKSRFLITLARHLLVQKKHVLFILHEDNPMKVKERIVSALIGVGSKEIKWVLREEYKKIFQEPQDPEVVYQLSKLSWANPNLTLAEWELFRQYIIQQLHTASELLKQYLHFVVWQKAGQMFVEDVLAEIKSINNELKAREGRGIDVIIDDYPALLRSRIRHEHERARLAYVYQCFNDVAAEIGAFCAYAVQVNRSAAKAMKTGESDTAIGLEDVSESYQIAMNSMSAISLNRSHEDQAKKILRIAAIKARDSSQNGILITRAFYNEGNLYGDNNMYTYLGLTLIRGLKSFFTPGYNITSTDSADRSLLEQERNLTQHELALLAQVPQVVQKLTDNSAIIAAKELNFGGNNSIDG